MEGSGSACSNTSLANLPLLVHVFGGVAVVRVVGDDMQLAVVNLVHEAARRLVQLDAIDPELQRTPQAWDERDGHDRSDEEPGDLHAVRPLDDVDHRRVGEDQGDGPESGRRPAAARRAESVTATAAEVIRTSTPVA